MSLLSMNIEYREKSMHDQLPKLGKQRILHETGMER